MTYSAVRVRATPGPPRSGAVGVAVAFFGIAVAAWVSIGRYLFGIGGDLTIVYTATLGVVFAGVFVLAGSAVRRAARRGFPTRPLTHTMIVSTGVLALFLGLTLPDATPSGLQTIISGANEPALGIAIGIANPLGVVGLTTGIIAVVLAIRDSRGRVTLIETWSDDESVVTSEGGAAPTLWPPLSS